MGTAASHGNKFNGIFCICLKWYWHRLQILLPGIQGANAVHFYGNFSGKGNFGLIFRQVQNPLFCQYDELKITVAEGTVIELKTSHLRISAFN